MRGYSHDLFGRATCPDQVRAYCHMDIDAAADGIEIALADMQLFGQ
ncbi:hypothetical protein ACS8Y6_12400 [Salinisphaera sp. RV14]